MIWRVRAPIAFMIPIWRICCASSPSIMVAVSTALRTTAMTLKTSSSVRIDVIWL